MTVGLNCPLEFVIATPQEANTPAKNLSNIYETLIRNFAILTKWYIFLPLYHWATHHPFQFPSKVCETLRQHFPQFSTSTRGRGYANSEPKKRPPSKQTIETRTIRHGKVKRNKRTRWSWKKLHNILLTWFVTSRSSPKSFMLPTNTRGTSGASPNAFSNASLILITFSKDDLDVMENTSA